MYFSEDELLKIRTEYKAVHKKRIELSEAYLTHPYTNAKAREHAQHGFSRRLETMARCIDNTFMTLPPDNEDFPEKEDLLDATINIQSFVFNAFGCIENLAWIWVSEKGLTKDDGSPIPKGWVGLGKKNKLVRRSFSPEFLEYLKTWDAWFNHLENFRHALAHRIPLYIPPYVVSGDNEAAYQEIEDCKQEAFARMDIAEHNRLSAKQKALCVFRPWMMHSFEEKTIPVVFHVQLLADFNTIEELGQKMLEEFSR